MIEKRSRFGQRKYHFLPSASVLLGRELRRARRSRNLTQRALAKWAGVDLATLRSIERGRGTVAPFISLLSALEYRFSGQEQGLHLGRWIARRRRSAGLSQDSLRKLTGLSKPTIIQVERGQGNLGSLAAVFSVLRVRITLRPNDWIADEVMQPTKMLSPLRYPGGKTKALRTLAYCFPGEIDEYREPFVGGASVAFFISNRFPKATIWINDTYTPLVSFWRVLQDPSRAAAMIARIINLKRMHPDERAARELFNHQRGEIDAPGVDELAQAVAFYVTNRCSFSGLTQSGSFSPQASSLRWTMQHIERLATFTPLLERWRITNLDYRQVVQEPWSGRAPLMFLDPPYDIARPNLYGDRGSTHTGFDHQDFRRQVEEVQARAMITYNASKPLRRMYAGWQQVIYDLAYSMNSHKKYRRHQRGRRELILINYEHAAPEPCYG